MTDWIPFFQTLTWPVFILFVFLWFRKEVTDVLTALAERIQHGAAVEIGQFKISASPPRPLDSDDLFRKVINPSLDKILVAVQAATVRIGGADSIAQKLTQAVDDARERIRDEGFLTVDSGPLLKESGKRWQVSYNQYRTVSALLDDIWASIGHLPNMSFGSTWILRDPKSGRAFTSVDMGRRWANKRGDSVDSRPLEEVGIRPGMTLEIVAPR